ncbi:MAG: hypothetical protein UU64_C0001G0056 [candidate division WWE3 bacterium GW2011_GWF2_41_45]|uniref:Glycosyltransferase RgtA/B/C/D-like domain-containing protein n=3 Tax=Katanobacteria TaxID=422282 RepID=A0A1F4W3L4_UNCKA|nr:MAG: hypothetical protein UU55_C0002G0033 [candidate division WWE3 bacterium GW2011_GWC2_41_23]KKS10787.1 MAG: hypothetical protein UU64_C0001G0056 [candidate division WWE3 bacterium GW2011_GWF2_41_45]KKS12463.1 MAG: hypothetical protein UU68_C0001G0055 [candidate division WWE3 bacterium GW2011_GWF1_41_53]KKS20158.1 MAG: hypothetical protein UU79_C0003G0031 [candidate division WWE3 bacterium GW2011_GWE1_41_72]KKS28724.1 MAG: hypothetical protein UU90_C0019G0017 [candidate division WWE3 bacte
MIKFIKNHLLEILFALLFIASRLPDLGNDTFNTDVWKWKARSYDFGTGVFTWDLEKTIQKYHPGVTLMWLGTAAIKVYNFYSESNPAENSVAMIFQLHFVQKLFVVTAIAVTLGLSLFVLKKLFGARKALLLVTLLSLEPFYLALTREFHLEGLMSTFMLASFLWLYYYTLDMGKKKRLVVSAVFAGLAFLTKTSALFMFPYAGLILLIEGRKNIVTALPKIGLWLLIFLATFTAFWPAMWAFPGQALAALYRGVSEIGIEREHVQFYFGKLVEDPGFFYYFVVLGLRSSYLLILGLIGTAIFWKKIFVEGQRKFLLYVLLFVGFYFAQLIIPSKKLDRYILPNIMMLSLITSLFWIWLLEKIKGRSFLKFIPLVIATAIPAFYLHPDYMSYYNPMFGGLKTGINVLEPKWLIGERQVINFFEKKMTEDGLNPVYGNTSLEKVLSGSEAGNALTVAFQEKYYTQIHPFFRVIGGYAVIEDLTPFAVKTKYFVYPVWGDISGEEKRFGLKYVDSIYLRGVEVYKVYERTSL